MKSIFNNNRQQFSIFFLSFTISALSSFLFFIFCKFIYFIYLFLAASGLRCCARALNSCCKWGPLFIVVRRLLIAVASPAAEHGLQARRLQQLWHASSRAEAQYLWHTGPAAPRHAGSSRTRPRTCVPCVGRRILNHCATKEALSSFLKQVI